MSDGEVLPSAYNLYRCDRRSRGGGVLIAVSDVLPSRQLALSESCEMVAVELVFKCFPSEYKMVITGDFNCPDIN